MRKVLTEKDYEITYLKKKLEEEKSMSFGNLNGGAFTSDVVASKLVDLGKKVRELTFQLESERTKNKQLTRNCHDVEVKLENLRLATRGATEEKCLFETTSQSDGDGEKRINFSKENKELREKLNQTSHKMMEFKSQCEILKQDLKKTQKVLLVY